MPTLIAIDIVEELLRSGIPRQGGLGDRQMALARLGQDCVWDHCLGPVQHGPVVAEPAVE